MVFAGYARTMIPKTVLAAATVDKALEESEISLAFYAKRGSPFLLSERFCNLFLLNLKGERPDPVSLSTEEIDENACLERWQTPATLFGHGLAYFLTSKLQLLFLFGETREAWRLAQAHADWMRYIPILYETTVFSFYRAMAAASLLEAAPEPERAVMAACFQASLAEFAVWARNCPENYAWQERLLRAEEARLAGRAKKALELFEQAAATAQRYKQPRGVALSRERAEQVHLALGNLDASRAFLEDASFNYYRWGAHAKVLRLREALDRRTPAIPQASFSQTSPSDSKSDIRPNSLSKFLDIGSILKATQAISREIRLASLLQVIMTSVIENAGAEQGFLLLPDAPDWSVAAMATVAQSAPTQENSPLAGSLLVSEAIVRYVIRSRMEVVLHDAGQHPTFQQDPHVLRRNVRSVMCVPLLAQNRLSGVLYLENNLHPGVFAVERTQIVKTLSAQAAISIENAKLYGSLAVSEQRYRSVFEGASDLIFLTTPEGRIVDVNPACMTIFGYTREEMLTFSMTDFYVDPRQREEFRRAIESAGMVGGFEIVMRRKDGEQIEAVLTANLRRDALGQILGYQGILRDVTSQKQSERLREAYSQELERQVRERTQELSEANEKLQRLSDCDGLTGIANRRKFDAVLESEWNRAKRNASPLALFMIDVDHFKAYNDHLGHHMGDECLRRIAQAIASTAKRAGELAARYGGEEFAVILPGLAGDSARNVADNLCASILKLAIAHEKSPTSKVVTVSIGVASCVPSGACPAESLVQAADANLYEAKRQGRNRMVSSFLDD